MRVGPRELVIWSFLMSSAHGAGLMLVPVLLGLPAPPEAADLPGLELLVATLGQDAAAVTVHSASMLLVMGMVAIVVYERLGVGRPAQGVAERGPGVVGRGDRRGRGDAVYVSRQPSDSVPESLIADS